MRPWKTLLFVLFTVAAAAAAPAWAVTGLGGVLPLAAATLEDRDGTLGIADVRRASAAGQFVPFQQPIAVAPRVRWFRIPIPASREPLMLLANSEIHTATLYEPGADARGRTFGTARGQIAISLAAADLGATVFVRAAGLSSILADDFRVDTDRATLAWIADENQRRTFYGAVFGTLTVAAGLLFALTRRAYFAWYGAYTIAVVAFFSIPMPLCIESIAPLQWIGVRWPFAFATGGAFGFGTIAARVFLDTAARAPRLDRALRAVALNGFVAFPLMEWQPELLGPLAGIYLTFTPVVIALLVVIAAAVRIRQGFLPARLYALGFAGLFAGLALDACWQLFGRLPEPSMVSTAPFIGLVWEAVMFLASLAYGLALSNRDRETALIDVALAQTRIADEQRRRAEDVERHNVAVRRFVPQEFLHQLDRTDITEITLGDHVEREMTILFSDIRAFTALNDALTPAESFAFVSAYFGRMAPVVRAHRGFIDKYVGDAMMALFPGPAADAASAAVALQREVRKFNAERQNDVPIRMGIGLHRGPLMLGTIGETQRMETTVIAESVNVASRLEDLTKNFGATILASANVIDALDDRSVFQVRDLGSIEVRGVSQPVEVFEIVVEDERVEIA